MGYPIQDVVALDKEYEMTERDILVRIPVGLGREVKILAARRGTTIKALITEAIKQFLKTGAKTS